MHPKVDQILTSLESVDNERDGRKLLPGLDEKVLALKAYQQRRFSHTYNDLLLSARYGSAARFFLAELYGPSDFRSRDAQFARVVPSLVRLFPRGIVETVAALAELHALSEQLDTAMAKQLQFTRVTAAAYALAWRATGMAREREEQISITMQVARDLDRLTRSPLVGRSLRLMRGPAVAAGLGELQTFLEAGFDAFKAMGGAEEFIQIIQTRERHLARLLFATTHGDKSIVSGGSEQGTDMLPSDIP